MTPGNEYATAARWTSAISAGVCLLMIVMLIQNVRAERRVMPLDAPEIAALKAELVERPNDEALKERLRVRDLELRSGYFTRTDRINRGAWLLVAAAGALAIALKSHSTLTRKIDTPVALQHDTTSDLRMARIGVAVSALLILGTSAAAALWARPTWPGAAAANVVIPEAASADELAKNQVSFRGFDGSGHVNGKVPAEWDATSGKGILWKTPLPLPGHSSPIVFGDNVFLTASDGALQEVICFAAGTGEIRWRGAVPRGSLETPETFEDTGFAAPTPVTDGARVYAIFASGDIGAFDFTGRRVWARAMGNPDSMYGYASSLALNNGNVIIQWDHGSEPEAAKSALICLDGKSGKPLWRTERPVANSWASPIVVNGVVYTVGMPWVIAYNAADGAEIWRAKVMEGDVACSPVWRDGVLYVANERAVAAAIRTDGSGDVTETHVLWKISDVTLPDMVSPLTDGKFVLLTHGGGEMTCLEAATGKVAWVHSVDHMVHASPILAAGTVYVTDHDGTTHAFELKDKFELLRTMKLDAKVAASPAVVNGKMYVRTEEHLVCIGK